jgi:hypothetical protein
MKYDHSCLLNGNPYTIGPSMSDISLGSNENIEILDFKFV